MGSSGKKVGDRVMTGSYEIISTVPINLEGVADLCQLGIKRKTPTPRDLSLPHVTNLLESAKLIAKGTPKYHEYEGEILGIMSLGRIWEVAIDCYLTKYAVDQGGVYWPDMDMIVDGVIGSLDGVMLRMRNAILSEYVVCETKLRFTANGEIPPSHLAQMRAYCHLASTDLAIYTSGHITARPPDARAIMSVIKFTQESIAETWQGIISTKNYLGSLGLLPKGRE